MSPNSALDLSTSQLEESRVQLGDHAFSAASASVSSNVEGLICNIDPSAIQNRWLKMFLPDADQHPKVAPPAINAYVSRMLKAYAGASVRRQVPPFVHETQLLDRASPLVKCLTLCGLCETGKDIAEELIQQEMSTLFDQRLSFDSDKLLSAFQAYLIYMMVLFFHLGQEDNTSLKQHMFNLQSLACDTCSKGVITKAELEHSRPLWHVWLAAESKRRTLYTMYLFDNLLCVRDGLPVFVATELRGLPAPCGRRLWRTASEEVWRAAYNQYIAQWDERGLMLEELWRPSLAADAIELQRRNDRIDQWLEDADEYCTMLYAVTSGTHGD